MSSPKRSKDAEKYRRLYKTSSWERIRLRILVRDMYTCQRCHTPLTQGRTRPTDAVVHHREPHRGDLQKFSDPENLEAVCKDCHDGAIQAEERGGTAIGEDGWPIAAP